MQVYDFVGANEMKEFRDQASTIMTRSSVIFSTRDSQKPIKDSSNQNKHTPSKRIYSTDRTSSSGIFVEKFPLLKRFQNKIEMFTGLSITNQYEQNEDPQVVSYTSLGSHISSHDDRVRRKLPQYLILENLF